MLFKEYKMDPVNQFYFLEVTLLILISDQNRRLLYTQDKLLITIIKIRTIITDLFLDRVI